MGSGAFGSCLTRSSGLQSVSMLTSHMPDGCTLTVTELRQDTRGAATTVTFERVPSLLFVLQLRGPVVQQMRIDGLQLPKKTLEKGAVCFYDVDRALTATFTSPFHSLIFQIPRSAITATGKAPELDRGNGLQDDDGNESVDAIIQSIGTCLLPQLHAEQPVNQPFVDHLFRALLNNLTVRHAGGITGCAPPQTTRGGLAAWQQRRAKELMGKHLIDGLALAQIAEVCRLSISAFARGFRISTGVSPHEWLLRRRIDCTLQLMRHTDLPLADIALQAGFVDQSHFTRTFGKRMGISPGAWRRASGPEGFAGPPANRNPQCRQRAIRGWQATQSAASADLRIMQVPN